MSFAASKAEGTCIIAEEAHMIDYRIADATDVRELATMRWDFRSEGIADVPVHDRDTFIDICAEFLSEGIADQPWTYWIAVADGQIVYHVLVQRIRKVPKPNRISNTMGYMTNVYTKPTYRNRGIGMELMNHVLRWAAEQDLESLIVWPSEDSVRFYEGAGFTRGSEMMEYELCSANE